MIPAGGVEKYPGEPAKARQVRYSRVDESACGDDDVRGGVLAAGGGL